MKNITVFGVLLASLLSGFNSYAISDSKVSKLLESVQQAKRKENINAVMSKLSKDVVVLKQRGSSEKSYDYDGYAKLLKDQFFRTSNYQYKVLDHSVVSIEGATVLKVKMKEMYFKGKKYHKETHDQSWWIKETAKGLEVSKVLIHN